MMTLEQALTRYPGAQTFCPGDSAALNTEILGLIRAGRKTCSCASLDLFGPGREAMPEPGRIDIALGWSGAPALAVRTERVEKVRFCDMTEDRVPAQGEFRNLAHWREGYRAYLTRNGGFDPQMMLMVETYSVVEDFATPAQNKDDSDV